MSNWWVYDANTLKCVAADVKPGNLFGDITWTQLSEIFGEPCDYAVDGEGSAEVRNLAHSGVVLKTAKGGRLFFFRQSPLPAQVALRMPEETDAATLRLVASSIPKYRNSDRCPKSGCKRQMQFKQMHLVCAVHGYPH